MARSATVAVEIIADASKATAGVRDAAGAMDDYARAADKADAKTRDVSGGIEKAGSTAGGFTQGLRDMSDAVAMAGFPELAAGMQVAAVGFESLDGAATLYSAAQQAASAAAGGFTKAMNVMKASILTNPIFIIAAIIIAIGVALVIAYQKSETFRRIVDAAFAAVANAVRVVWDWIKKLADIIGGALVNAWNLVKSAASKFFDIVTAPIRTLIDLIERVVSWLGRIKWPSPPDWLKTVGSALGGVFGRTAAPSLAPVSRRGTAVTAAAPVTITVNGALDPDAVARQIRRVLATSDRRTGRAYQPAVAR